MGGSRSIILSHVNLSLALKPMKTYPGVRSLTVTRVGRDTEQRECSNRRGQVRGNAPVGNAPAVPAAADSPRPPPGVRRDKCVHTPTSTRTHVHSRLRLHDDSEPDHRNAPLLQDRQLRCGHALNSSPQQKGRNTTRHNADDFPDTSEKCQVSTLSASVSTKSQNRPLHWDRSRDPGSLPAGPGGSTEAGPQSVCVPGAVFHLN